MWSLVKQYAVPKSEQSAIRVRIHNEASKEVRRWKTGLALMNRAWFVALLEDIEQYEQSSSRECKRTISKLVLGWPVHTRVANRGGHTMFYICADEYVYVLHFAVVPDNTHKRQAMAVVKTRIAKWLGAHAPR
jgi:phage-related protein